MNGIDFEKLASELEVLAKAQTMSEEDKVSAAAADAGVATEGAGAATGEAGEGEGAGTGEEDEEGEEDEQLGKSFHAVGENGEQVKAFDATSLLKAMLARLDAVEAASADVDERREHLGKSLGLISDLLQKQDALIKSQSTKVDELSTGLASANATIETLTKALNDFGNQGVGRRATLSVTDPAPASSMLKSEGASVTRSEFLAKADVAFKAGKISGAELSVAENYLNHGKAVPEGIVSRVMGNQ